MSDYQYRFRDHDGRYRVVQVCEKGETNVLEIRDTWLGEQENILLDRTDAEALAEVLMRYSKTGSIEPDVHHECLFCGFEWDSVPDDHRGCCQCEAEGR